MPHCLRHRPQDYRASQAELPPLRIVLVYDSFADLIRVNDIWSRLAARFRNEIQIVSCAWNFASLRDPQFSEHAAMRAIEADLIVLSANGRSELPEYIRQWIKAWLPWKKGRCDALAAALGHEPPVRGNALPLRNYLRHTAEESGMAFFCNAGRSHSLMETGASL